MLFHNPGGVVVVEISYAAAVRAHVERARPRPSSYRRAAKRTGPKRKRAPAAVNAHVERARPRPSAFSGPRHRVKARIAWRQRSRKPLLFHAGNTGYFIFSQSAARLQVQAKNESPCRYRSCRKREWDMPHSLSIKYKKDRSNLRPRGRASPPRPERCEFSPRGRGAGSRRICRLFH